MNNKGFSEIEFKRIFEKYRRLVVEIALSILGDYDLTEDVLQSTFISVAKNFYKLDSDSEETKNYIAATAHNTALKYLKKVSLIRENEVPFPDEETDDEKKEGWSTKKELSTESFEDMLIDKIDRIRLFEVLERLDTKHSVYIREYYLDELTMKEIAEKHGVKVDTAKKRLYRGLEKFKKLLRKDGFIK